MKWIKYKEVILTAVALGMIITGMQRVETVRAGEQDTVAQPITGQTK